MSFHERLALIVVALLYLPGAIWGFIWIFEDFSGWTVTFTRRDSK